jgi:hypothetical protein
MGNAGGPIPSIAFTPDQPPVYFAGLFAFCARIIRAVRPVAYLVCGIEYKAGRALAVIGKVPNTDNKTGAICGIRENVSRRGVRIITRPFCS